MVHHRPAEKNCANVLGQFPKPSFEGRINYRKRFSIANILSKRFSWVAKSYLPSPITTGLVACRHSIKRRRRKNCLRWLENQRGPATRERQPDTGLYKIPCSGPPGAAISSMRRVTFGSSTSGGAWCGLMRASRIKGPAQPQCLRTWKAPRP